MSEPNNPRHTASKTKLRKRAFIVRPRQSAVAWPDYEEGQPLTSPTFLPQDGQNRACQPPGGRLVSPLFFGSCAVLVEHHVGPLVADADRKSRDRNHLWLLKFG